MPITDDAGNVQGAVMVLDDITETASMQAELKRKQQELEELDNRYREMYARIKMADMEKDENKKELTEVKTQMNKITNEVKNLTGILEEKQNELDRLNKSIELKTKELSSIMSKTEKTKSELIWLESELQKRQSEFESSDENIETSLNKAWMDRVKMHEEIDKHLGIAESELRTKKLAENDDNSEES